MGTEMVKVDHPSDDLSHHRRRAQDAVRLLQHRGFELGRRQRGRPDAPACSLFSRVGG
jgi:hypothetical protein